ncbi:hypothetical protein [Endozoicomonas atrinae]|uniref:hypothetical protein n=1 Tax=Endozoicomonas atrinae TaxID=1333660 RepID=UPI0008259C11|nr:hypothetical protein [Endozoicomonas atrinae]
MENIRKKKLMQLKEISSEYGISKTKLQKIAGLEEFPKPVCFGRHMTKLYRRKDVEVFFGC